LPPMNTEAPRPDIHGYEERVRRYLVLIAESGIPDEDKKALIEFSVYYSNPGKSIATGSAITLTVSSTNSIWVQTDDSASAHTYPVVEPFSTLSGSLPALGTASPHTISVGIEAVG